MAYEETHEDLFDNAGHFARVKYAAFLYDDYLTRENSHNRALTFACRKASITYQALRAYLPTHNKKKRNARDYRILEMRSEGFSINLIADIEKVNRATVSRVLDKHDRHRSAARKYDGMKIRGRLKIGDHRLDPFMLTPTQKAVHESLTKPHTVQ